MDRIEPIRPSPPAIAPADVTRVRRIARDSDRPDPRGHDEGSEQSPTRRGRTPADRHAEQPPDDPEREDGEDGRPHIDVRA